MLIDASTFGSLEVLDGGALAGIARVTFAEAADGPEKQRMMALMSVAVLLILLFVVLIMLARAIKKAKPQAVAAAAAAPGGIDPTKENVQAHEEMDLTRMRVFTPDLLPKLSFDEREGDEDAPQSHEDSKPNLVFEGDAWVGIDEPTGQHDLITTAAAGATDKGLKRTKNEDAWLVDANLDLYVVADGMGGYAGGDVAANMTVAEIRRTVESGDVTGNAHVAENAPKRGRELVEAIEKANGAVNDLSTARHELTGMGTTILATRFSKKKQRLFCAHVGDTRLYRFRAGKLQQLTVDHTLGAKGVTGPLASNVRRAIGVAKSVNVDLLVDKPMPEDLYLLCSDGMYKMLSDADTSAILAAKRSSPRWNQADLESMVKAIIEAANKAGGKDNISVVIIGIREAGAKA